MISRLYIFYNRNLSFQGLIIGQQDPIQRRFIKFLFILSLLLIIWGGIKPDGYGYLLFIGLFLSLVVGLWGQYANYKIVRKKFPDVKTYRRNWIFYGFNKGEFDDQVRELLKTYLEKKKIDQKNQLKEIILALEKKSQNKKLPLIAQSAAFFAFLIPIWSSLVDKASTFNYFNVEGSFANELSHFLTPFFLIVYFTPFILFALVISFFVPTIQEIRDRFLISDYFKLNELIELIREIMIERERE